MVAKNGSIFVSLSKNKKDPRPTSTVPKKNKPVKISGVITILILLIYWFKLLLQYTPYSDKLQAFGIKKALIRGRCLGSHDFFGTDIKGVGS